MAAATDFIAGGCYTACALDRTIVFVWTDMPTLDGVAAMVDLVERVLARTPGQLGMLISIQPKAGHAVSAPVRERLQQLMREYAARIAGVAFVFGAPGASTDLLTALDGLLRRSAA